MSLPIVVSVLVAVIGCRTQNTVEMPAVEAQLKAIAVGYGRYTGQHQGVAPTNLEEFKKFFATISQDELNSLRVKSIDELFISPRDKQPFTIVLSPSGTTSAGAAPVAPIGAQSPVAYETVGLNGKRYVGFSLGMVEEVDETRFRQLVPQ